MYTFLRENKTIYGVPHRGTKNNELLFLGKG